MPLGILVQTYLDSGEHYGRVGMGQAWRNTLTDAVKKHKKPNKLDLRIVGHREVKESME